MGETARPTDHFGHTLPIPLKRRLPQAPLLVQGPRTRAGARHRSAWHRTSARYIIPPMSGMPAPAPAGVFSGASATIASVVRMFFAIDAAFCSAERVTIVGSVIPAL